jgi:hypothetical protein
LITRLCQEDLKALERCPHLAEANACLPTELCLYRGQRRSKRLEKRLRGEAEQLEKLLLELDPVANHQGRTTLIPKATLVPRQKTCPNIQMAFCFK